jgi:hypothetical protein
VTEKGAGGVRIFLQKNDMDENDMGTRSDEGDEMSLQLRGYALV